MISVGAVEVGDTTIAYRWAGSGPPLVMLHGGWSDGREWPRTLVLASAYAGWAGSLPADVVAERVQRVLDDADRPPEEWVSSYLPGLFAGPVDQAIVDEITEIMCAARPAGIKPMVTAFAETDLRDALGDITVPTLLLYGELDERAPLAVARDLHARIPASTLTVMPGVGHCTNLEAPALFNDIVRRFLARRES